MHEKTLDRAGPSYENFPEMAEQPELFDFRNDRAAKRPAHTRQIVHVVQPDQTASEAQRTFHRLIKRLERRREELKTLEASAEKNLAYYLKELVPLRNAIVEARKDLIRTMAKRLRGRTLPIRNWKAHFRQIISRQFQRIHQSVYTISEPDLQEIFAEVETITYEEAREEDFQAALCHMEDLMEEEGIKVDFEGLNYASTPEEMVERVQRARAEQADQREQEEAAHPNSAPRSAAERRRQEAEELQKRDIGLLYRQLAKLLHPDREQDPVRRAEKEIAMQELNAAYAKDDLHTILRLEMQWITHEDLDPSQFPDAKLEAYNRVLKQQIKELETQMDALPDKPRYTRLSSTFYPGETFLNFDGPVHKELLEYTLETLRSFPDRLSLPDARDYLEELKEL